MPDSNPIQKYDLNATINQDSFELKGHPGRWSSVITVPGTTTVDFTGSNYGAGALILTNTNCTIHFSDGGSIPGSLLTTNTLYEFSVSKVVNAAATIQYVFIRNGNVR